MRITEAYHLAALMEAEAIAAASAAASPRDEDREGSTTMENTELSSQTGCGSEASDANGCAEATLATATGTGRKSSSPSLRLS
jgi:hypothetical protein